MAVCLAPVASPQLRWGRSKNMSISHRLATVLNDHEMLRRGPRLEKLKFAPV